MIKGFSPADFAPKQDDAPNAASAAAPAAADLGGASFLFTGKMATMQRKEAEDNVRKLGGDFEVRSKVGRGTSVVISLPCKLNPTARAV